MLFENIEISVPRFKDGLGIYYEKERESYIHFVFFSSNIHKVFELEDEYFELLKLIKQEIPVQDIIKNLTFSYSNISKDDILETLNVLNSENIIEEARDPYKKFFSTEEISRYQRQVELWSEYSTNNLTKWEIQYKIKQSHVLVIGAGGIGSWVIQSLAMMGIGVIKIVDFDSVEIHNLSRQALYKFNDIGTQKIKVLEREIEKLNKNITVEKQNKKISNSDDLLPLLEDIDLVINCADDPDINITAEWVSKSCEIKHIPHIIAGGYVGHIGKIGTTIIPGETNTWLDFQEKFQERNKYSPDLISLFDRNQRHSGAMAPLSAIIANFQVWDAIKVLTGINLNFTKNRTGELDINSLSIEWDELT
ncbi:HesA/MoeB/ThiF family protein [Paraliobacillus ryukyuensis]|uniref:HesA/MoeB/ThiF family protein n=1 Tax=Paraliobacillus ryukyuensis TaxID=200904 RepID=UPI0009A8549E|nr:ThiF family adenylyltransferase [Paraliobacillus ryukyuensis]